MARASATPLLLWRWLSEPKREQYERAIARLRECKEPHAKA